MRLVVGSSGRRPRVPGHPPRSGMLAGVERDQFALRARYRRVLRGMQFAERVVAVLLMHQMRAMSHAQ